jgi:kumamolisin
VLSREDFVRIYGAAETNLDAVAEFARSHGLQERERSIARRTIVLSGTVSQASHAFGTELWRYEHGEESYRGREGAIHVPAHLADIVEGVFGLDNRRMARQVATAAGPAQATVPLTPPQVSQLYGFPGGDGAGQTIGLVEFPPSGYTHSDMKSFFSGLGLSTPTITAVPPSGNTPGQNAGQDTEVALDIDVAGSVAPGARIAVYFAPSFDEQGWVDVITKAIHDAVNAPSVLSISWGWPENDSNRRFEWSQNAIDAISATFEEASHLGVTVLAAAGDSGSSCGEGDGRAHALYPASDPYVTCCGGTMISNVFGSSFTEHTWVTNGATGGGVSDIFDLPQWQDSAGVPPSANGDGRVGRGIPDIAGNAAPTSGYEVVSDGSRNQIGGTSAVAPLYAGLVALINASLGVPIGYLNPDLYDFTEEDVYSDVNDGRSNATGGAPGYTSGPGWDACTGLGSINGNSLLTSLRAVVATDQPSST